LHAFQADYGRKRDLNARLTRVFDSTDRAQDVRWAEDCAQSLRWLTAIIEAAKLPLPDAWVAADVTDGEIDAVLASESRLVKHRYALSMQIAGTLPFDAIFNVDSRIEALRELTDAAVGIERYRLAHQKLPEQLEELVPIYLPQAPRDSFSGERLLYRTTESGAIVYSVANNRRDDAGEMDEGKMTPDLAVKIHSHAQTVAAEPK
jgi:hypothetical protein